MSLPSRIARAISSRARARFTQLYRNESHADALLRVLADAKLGKEPVFVETGCGLSTLALAELAERAGGVLHSFDASAEKVAALRERSGPRLAQVSFWIGDSLDGLRRLCATLPRVDVAFLDSAPSARHTFEEFRILEPRLAVGARLVIDNAALPSARLRLSPCRKGAILVPYLLASPFWEVTALPRSGDSMIAAELHAEPDHADPTLEDPGYVDDWRLTFRRGLR